MKADFLKVFLFAIIPCSAWSQAMLMPEEAIEIALKQNYSILISGNQKQAASNLATPGNAGFLPSVAFTGIANTQNNDIRQEFSNGLIVDRKSIGSQSFSSGIAVSWTLFDGRKMFVNLEQLKTGKTLSDYQLKITIENTVADILIAYFEIVRFNQELKALDIALNYAEQRVIIAKNRQESGAGFRQQYLQTQIDRNACLSTILNTKAERDNRKIRLNELLGRDVSTEFMVLDSIPLTYNPKLTELQTSILKKNNELLSLQTNKRMAELNVNQFRSERYPQIGLATGYNYSLSSSEGGFALFNRGIGPSLGLRFSWMIFNGGILNTAIKNAKLGVERQEYLLRSTELHVSSSLLIAYRNFLSAMEIRKLEFQNYDAAKENLELANERFKAGNGDILLVKDADRSFHEALSRLMASSLEAKKAELELMRLNGDLVK